MLERRMMAMVGIGLLAAALICPAYADSASDAVKAAQKKLDGQASYHLSLSEQSGVTDIEYTAPDTVRITKPQSVTVLVNGVMYSNAGNGWGTVASNSATYLLRRLLQQDVLIAVSATDRVTDDGTEVLDGISVHRYEILGEGTQKRTVWIDTRDGLPRQVQQDGDGAFTATYADFGKDFGITAPTIGPGASHSH